MQTLRVFGIGAGPPVGGGRQFRRPPLHRTPTSGTLAPQTSSLGGATFGRKRNFWQISATQPGNLGVHGTPATSRRKLVIRAGKAAAKISAARITAFELLAIESIKKLKIPNFRDHLRHMHGRGGVPECVICDACSILWVQFLTLNFSHYTVSDLLFAEYVRAQCTVGHV